MHIGIDASRAVSRNWGGPENYSYYLIRALAKIDKTNRYTLYVNQKPPRPLASQPNFEIRRIPFPRLWTQAGLALDCLLRPPDILFVPVHAIPFVHRLGLKTVLTVHDLEHQFLSQHYKLPQKIYLDFYTSYSIKRATRVIAVSKATRNDIIERFGVPQEKIEVIYEGYASDLFYPRSEDEIAGVRKKYKLAGDYFLAVGTVQPRKNYERLIEAFSKIGCGKGISHSELGSESKRSGTTKTSKILKQIQDDKKNRLSPLTSHLSLLIAGKRGWLYNGIYEAPQQFGIENQVNFLGHVPDQDLPALISGAVGVVYPSLYEGFGLVSLEAMACGTPVITSNISALPESAGEAGIKVDPYSIDEITAAMRKVLGLSKNEREALVEKGFQHIKNFSWTSTGRQTLKVFESLSNSR